MFRASPNYLFTQVPQGMEYSATLHKIFHLYSIIKYEAMLRWEGMELCQLCRRVVVEESTLFPFFSGFIGPPSCLTRLILEASENSGFALVRRASCMCTSLPRKSMSSSSEWIKMLLLAPTARKAYFSSQRAAYKT